MDNELSIKLNNTLNGTSLKAIQDKNGNDIVETYLTKNSSVNSTSSIDIGMIIPFAGNNDIPVGFLLCNGASINRETYSDLFSVIGTTYGSVDDEHFNLPDLIDKFIEGSNIGGEYKEAGLPNIEGNNSSGVLGAKNPTNKGAIFYSYKSATNSSGSTTTSSNVLGYLNLDFDASLSNPIYGNSDTVQPSSLTVRYIIKAFNGTSSSTTDLEITKVANDLADKANRDLSNLTDVGKKSLGNTVIESVINEDGSWYRLYSDGWVEQGGICATTVSSNYRLLTFIYPFTDVNYNVLYVAESTNTNSAITYCGIRSKTTTNVYIANLTSGGTSQYPSRWYACGMGA